VKTHGTTAIVNLLLNRRSPQLDVQSHLPYQGLVFMNNKQAQDLVVRLPAWVSRKDVTCAIDSNQFEPLWRVSSLFFPRLRGGERISIQFPIQERTEKLVAEEGREYQARFKGNTVVEISPKDKGIGYHIYQRAFYKANEAPEKATPAYVPTKVLKWT
jgi:hypothetical protein